LREKYATILLIFLNILCMTFQVLTGKKKEIQQKILLEFGLSKSFKLTGIVCLQNSKTLESLIDGISILPANFIVLSERTLSSSAKNIVCMKNISPELEIGLDFMVSDNETEKFDTYFKKGMVPIVPSKNYMGSLLKEFNPVKAEGNSYLYGEETHWEIFYALVRYLENAKFPYDNRNLVKNIFEM